MPLDGMFWIDAHGPSSSRRVWQKLLPLLPGSVPPGRLMTRTRVPLGLVSVTTRSPTQVCESPTPVAPTAVLHTSPSNLKSTSPMSTPGPPIPKTGTCTVTPVALLSGIAMETPASPKGWGWPAMPGLPVGSANSTSPPPASLERSSRSWIGSPHGWSGATAMTKGALAKATCEGSSSGYAPKSWMTRAVGVRLWSVPTMSSVLLPPSFAIWTDTRTAASPGSVRPLALPLARVSST